MSVQIINDNLNKQETVQKNTISKNDNENVQKIVINKNDNENVQKSVVCQSNEETVQKIVKNKNEEKTVQKNTTNQNQEKTVQKSINYPTPIISRPATITVNGEEWEVVPDIHHLPEEPPRESYCSFLLKAASKKGRYYLGLLSIWRWI